MAIIDNEILKGCRGKLGDFIVYQYRGKTCLRAKPERAKITFSSEMVCQQKRMAGAAALYQAAKAIGIHHIWNQAAKGTELTGYNLFVKRNILAFSGVGHVGDFGKVHLTTGSLPLPDRMSIAPGAEDEWILTWDNITSCPSTTGEDRLVVVLMKQEGGFLIKTPVIGNYRRKHCRAVIRLSTAWQGYPYMYCYFCSARGSKFSENSCFLLFN